jgi:hypothetical protein
MQTSDEEIIKKFEILQRPKPDIRTYIWFSGILFVSTGVTLYDVRAGLIVAGVLFLLTTFVSD